MLTAAPTHPSSAGLLHLLTGRASPSPAPEGVQEGADAARELLGDGGGTLLTVALAFAVGWVLVYLAFQLARLTLGRRPALRAQVVRLATPASLAAGLVGARIGLGVVAREQTWFRGVSFAFFVALAAAAAWGAWRLVDMVEHRVLGRYRQAGVNDRRERRIRTQTMLIRRILNAAIIVVALAAVLLAIPEVRSLGTGLLASAGLLSVVAGLAVQSTLTNVFAGVQLAFTDSIRVGDVVDMEGVFGTVEEITLSNVVLKRWDGRRMVYPSSHFTTQPFENWTRVGSAVAGVVELDVDWRVPMDALRARLGELLASTELWDGRENAMQVTDAVGGVVRVRAVVSARTSGELWDLRCLVREDLVSFLRQEHPEGIVAQRLTEGTKAAPHRASGPVGGEGSHADPEARTGRRRRGGEEPRPRTAQLPVLPPASPRPTTAPLTRVDPQSALYTGSITALQRNLEMAGPGEDAYAERRAQRAAQQGEDVEETPGAHAARPDQPETGQP